MEHDINTGKFGYEVSRDRFVDACYDNCIDPDHATITSVSLDGNMLNFEIAGPPYDHLKIECVTCGTPRTHASSYLRDHQVPGYVFENYCTTCRANGDGWLVEHIVVERVEVDLDIDDELEEELAALEEDLK